MDKNQRIKEAMESEQFERVVSQMFSSLMASNPSMKPNEAMDYAMTQAYMYTVNYDSALRRHMIQRMRDAKEKQQ